MGRADPRGSVRSDGQGAPAVTYTLAERMAHHKVPGVSIAVVDNGRIVWARGYGLRRWGRPTPWMRTRSSRRRRPASRWRRAG
ncbi:MAG: serine hydrolase [Gemmatimonadetes bacterium]|nr:serine hydrolase [Gemmatimonadota bacterium]